MDEFFKSINFPYETVRAGQDDFIKKVYNSIINKTNIMIQAPTGLGKTVSALAPAIKLAKQHDKTIICLTSRQTQANQIIQTIKDINAKSTQSNCNNLSEIKYVAFIGKRSMCVHEDKDLYPSGDFFEFCKKTKEKGKCSYIKNFRNSDYEEKIKAILDETSKNFMSVENFVNFVSSPTTANDQFISGFCPYEMATLKAFKSDIIICDFNYVFAEGIKENFFGKIGRTLDDCILIVDEAHNLPDRIRNSHSYILSTEGLKNALKELKDFVKSSEYDPYITNLRIGINDIYHDKLLGDKTSHLMRKNELIENYLNKFEEKISLKEIIDKLSDIEALVKEERIISYIGRVATFLKKWNELDEEIYLRILEKNISKDKTVLSLKIKCIDPSNLVKEALNNSHSSILMSGTLSPLTMYKDILGLEKNTELLEIESPFSKDKQLTLVIDDVTSKYSSRSLEMYTKIANHCVSLLNAASEKNSIIFFPSYDFMDKVMQHINILKINRVVLKEQRYMTKDQKEKFVEKFKDKSGYIDQKSKVLFAITSGSFAEGLDLPNTALEMVVVIGLPLSVPDLFTQAVIRHFDKKFKRGQMYGYINPAISKIIQAAGRCIRTEQDKGVVVLMDNRFFWPLYAKNFPAHWNIKKSSNYQLEIGNFFN